MPEHQDISDPHIHEPKGITAASANTVYVANGAGGGSWVQVPIGALDLPGIRTDIQSQINTGLITIPRRLIVTGTMGGSDTAANRLALVPIQTPGTLTRFSIVVHDTLSEDEFFFVQNAAGANVSAGLTLLESSVSPLQQFSQTATGNNVIASAPSFYRIVRFPDSTGNATKISWSLEFEFTL